MIGHELEISLYLAYIKARQWRHEFISVEHVLLSLLDNQSVVEVLCVCSANIDDLRKSLIDHMKGIPTVSGTEGVDVQPTLEFQRAFQYASGRAQSTGKEIAGVHLLHGILLEKESYAFCCLHQQGVTRLGVVNACSRENRVKLSEFRQELDKLGEVDTVLFRIYVKDLRELLALADSLSLQCGLLHLEEFFQKHKVESTSV